MKRLLTINIDEMSNPNSVWYQVSCNEHEDLWATGPTIFSTLDKFLMMYDKFILNDGKEEEDET